MGEIAFKRWRNLGTKLGDLPVGSIVKLKESGVSVEYVIVNQGIPQNSALYDASCNGTWLLRKNIFEVRQWNSSNTNDWANSTLKSYLDSVFFYRFAADIQNSIKQVKVPYRPGSGISGAINSGVNGLSCKVFLLSGYEIGWTWDDSHYFPIDGSKLSYFESGTGTTANNKRVGFLGESAEAWWLRSPFLGGTVAAWCAHVDGGYDSNNCGVSKGVRPALVFPPEITFPRNLIITK